MSNTNTIAGMSDPARQAVSDGNNHGSAPSDKLPVEGRTVAAEGPAEVLVAPPQVRDVISDDAAHCARLAAANQYLVIEVNEMARQLAVARRGMLLLETVATDWNEAADLIGKWKEVTK